MIEQLFYQLIRVALGTQETLSPTPSPKQWQALYDMAKKQSLVGICFVGVQRLSCTSYDNDNKNGNENVDKNGNGNENDNGNGNHNHPYTDPCEVLSTRWNLPELQYLKWMGMAAKIQQRNETVNRQCVELQRTFAVDGIATRILKGQGIAVLYKSSHQQDKNSTSDLSFLRQSGDIDLWVDAPKDQVVAWAKAHGETEPAGYLHVGCRVFGDTEVELHYRPTYCRCLWHNARMQKFCEKRLMDYEIHERLVVPTWDFNVVYILSHIYRHLFGLGIGMRQLMDYYFVLCTQEESGLKGLSGESSNHSNSSKLLRTLRTLGLYKFASAVMYVLREVFHMDERYMICPVDEHRGRALLRDVMLMGNFGHQDERQKKARKTISGSLWWKLKRDMELVRFYPAETLSEPIWKLVRMINKK